MAAMTASCGTTGVVGAADPERSDEWDRFVRSHPEAAGYHMWGWRRVFEHGLGHRCHYLAARTHGVITGVLPLVEIRSRLFGRALSSLPFVNYGGVLASDEGSAAALAEAAASLADGLGLGFVVLRHKRRAFPGLPARDHKVTMLLDLAPSRDAMWRTLDRKVRNQIRKAEKCGVTAASGGAELLGDFYRIFARNMRDLGTPVYGRSLFAAILAQFPREARIHVASVHGRPVAAALSYAWRDWIEVPSASSLREHRALCPNHLLYWSIILQAIDEGRRVFDFGRSTPGDGAYHFKTQWGGSPAQLWWEYILRGGAALPADDRHSPRYQAAIAAWRKLPVSLATLIGPRIARAVP